MTAPAMDDTEVGELNRVIARDDLGRMWAELVEWGRRWLRAQAALADDARR